MAVGISTSFFFFFLSPEEQVNLSEVRVLGTDIFHHPSYFSKAGFHTDSL